METVADRDCDFVCTRHAFSRAKLRLRNEFFAGRLDTWEMMDDWLCRLAHEAIVAGQDYAARRSVVADGIRIGIARVGNTILVTTAISESGLFGRLEVAS